MAPYWKHLVKRQGNVMYTADGNVWVNYILNMPAVNVYDDSTIGRLQSAHEELFRNLSEIGSDDILLGGFLAHVPGSEIMARIVQGIPNFNDRDLPEAKAQIEAFHRQVKTGFINERQRIYWLSVRYPRRMSFWSRFSAKFFETDPHETVTDTGIAKFEKKVFQALPASVGAVRTQPEHLDWVYDRATMRGVLVPDKPYFPARGEGPAVRQGTGSFPEVTIDEAAEGTSLMADFVKRFDEKDPDLDFAKDTFLNNFKSVMDSTIIAVERPDFRSSDFPSGATSYQGLMSVSGYPTRMDNMFSGFTAIVDQATGMDGDFVMRLSYAPHMESNATLTKTLKNLQDEDDANTKSTLDRSDYDDRRREVLSYHRAIRDDRAPVPMRVTTIFAFGSANLNNARTGVRTIRTKMEQAGFRMYQPTGGKRELWEAMLPGVAADTLVRDLAGLTTARLLAGYAPVRRYLLGDGVGVPVATNNSNALGQIIHMDLLDATSRGNASITITGAQGKGKSHLMKVLVAWMNDLRQYTVMLDSQGEWATFASQFASHQVINLVRPNVSIDPLKIINDDDKLASSMLVDLLMPMFGIPTDSEAAAEFAVFVSPENRKLHPNRNTTRGVFEDLLARKMPVFAPLHGVIRTMLSNPMMAAFVDPEENGRVINLPPAQMEAHNIVFLTKGLRLPRPGQALSEMNPQERYTIMVNTAVARLTAWRFDQVAETGAFVGDEMSFYKGSEVLKPLIQDQDRAGRKVKKFIIAGSQTADEFDQDEYALVRNRFAMGQERRDNSIRALEYAEFEPTDRLVEAHIHDTSPLDPNNNKKPMAGRAGEGYFNDGVNKGRIQVLPHFIPSRARKADTTAGSYERYNG